MEKKITPLFRWAGGKNKMLKHYNSVMPSSYNTYVEPFFGGGAMFINVKSKHPTLPCYINDINPSIMAIYYSIQNDTNTFMNVIDELDKSYIPLTKEKRKEFYYKVRSEHAWNYQKWDKTTESAVFFFLLRTCFNGILQINQNTNNRFGTPAGLLNEKDSVYSKENVLAWNRLLQNCIISSVDWKDCVKSIPKKDTFFFCDPPYRGCFTSYGQTFTDDDQLELLEYCKEVDNEGGYVMLCNQDTNDDFWKDKQGNLMLKKVDSTHTAGRRKRHNGSFLAKPSTEILFYSNNTTGRRPI